MSRSDASSRATPFWPCAQPASCSDGPAIEGSAVTPEAPPSLLTETLEPTVPVSVSSVTRSGSTRASSFRTRSQSKRL